MPETASRDSDETLLEGFLRDRDCPCPICQYNLRGLAGATCPECGSPPHLSLNSPNTRVGPFVLALAPLLMIGGVGVLLLIAIARHPQALSEGLQVPMAAGALSLLTAAWLLFRRTRFLCLSREAQSAAALAAWSAFLFACGWAASML
jgi:hypothetical protein